MSQRGSRPIGAQPTIWWGHCRRICAFISILTLGTTLSVIAQDTIPLAIPSKTVVLRADGAERQVTVQLETVRELLNQESITLNQYDVCEPLPATALTDGMTVKVTRKTFEIIRERVPVPQPVVTRWDRRMTVTPVVLHEGRPGVATQTRCIWKKDGVVSEQWVQNKKIIQQPKQKVVIRGRIPSRSGASGRRVLTVVATAYDPGPGSCGPYADGYTAIGLKATKGVIAVDPRVIPLGSRVYVDGYGPAVAGDVGGAIKGRRIDVCFPTRREALQWGRRTVKVVVL